LIKLNNEQARWLYIYLMHTDNIDEQELARLYGNGSEEDGRIIEPLWDQRGENGFESIAKTPAQLREELAQQLLRPFTDGEEVTLLEKVLQMLGSPNARNILSGRTLTQLRKALLNPEEIAKLNNATHSCAGCGKDFALGEVATSYVDLQTGSGRLFYCARCRKPTSYACQAASCDGTIELKYDMKKRCPNHREGAQESTPAESPFGQNSISPSTPTPSSAGLRPSVLSRSRLQQAANRLSGSTGAPIGTSIVSLPPSRMNNDDDPR
jgi:predicted RNA-binding Zn-ribbon protein involved in translation (DUF1610 family)